MSVCYTINKGINRSIEFKGLKAQYIIYLAVGLVILLLLFAILFLVGVNSYVCLAIIVPGAAGLIVVVRRYSNRYGEHGLTKEIARRSLPATLRTSSRKVFIALKFPSDAKE